MWRWLTTNLRQTVNVSGLPWQHIREIFAEVTGREVTDGQAQGLILRQWSFRGRVTSHCNSALSKLRPRLRRSGALWMARGTSGSVNWKYRILSSPEHFGPAEEAHSSILKINIPPCLKMTQRPLPYKKKKLYKIKICFHLLLLAIRAN